MTTPFNQRLDRRGRLLHDLDEIETFPRDLEQTPIETDDIQSSLTKRPSRRVSPYRSFRTARQLPALRRRCATGKSRE